MHFQISTFYQTIKTYSTLQTSSTDYISTWGSWTIYRRSFIHRWDLSTDFKSKVCIAGKYEALADWVLLLTYAHNPLHLICCLITVDFLSLQHWIQVMPVLWPWHYIKVEFWWNHTIFTCSSKQSMFASVAFVIASLLMAQTFAQPPSQT